MAYPHKSKKPSAGNGDALFLEPSLHTIKEIFDNAKEAILVTHDDGVAYCYVNRSACEITGYNFGELMNLGFKNLVHPDEPGKIEDRFEKRRKGVIGPVVMKPVLFRKTERLSRSR